MEAVSVFEILAEQEEEYLQSANWFQRIRFKRLTAKADRLVTKMLSTSHNSNYEASPKSIVKPKVTQQIKVKIGEIVKLKPIDFS